MSGGEWQLLIRDGFEGDPETDNDQVEDGEIIVPAPWKAWWVKGGSLGAVRPSVKSKDKRPPFNHSEVYSGNRAVSIGTSFAAHDSWLALRLNGVREGTPIRVRAVSMGVSFHDDGDQVGGGLGQVVGLSQTENLADAIWGEWWSSDVDGWEQRKWAQIQIETTALADDPYVLLRSVAREAWQAQYSHFDQVEIHVQDTSPPPTGGYTAVIYDPAGVEIARCSFDVPPVASSRICELAQEIVALSCPGG